MHDINKYDIININNIFIYDYSRILYINISYIHKYIHILIYHIFINIFIYLCTYIHMCIHIYIYESTSLLITFYKT